MTKSNRWKANNRRRAAKEANSFMGIRIGAPKKEPTLTQIARLHPNARAVTRKWGRK